MPYQYQNQNGLDDPAFIKDSDYTPETTLAAALEHMRQHRWPNPRTNQCAYNQGGQAVKTLQEVCGKGEATRLRDVKNTHIKMAVRQWRAAGLAGATINRRLAVLSQMGLNVSRSRQPNRKTPRWWLKPDQYKTLRRLLVQSTQEIDRAMIDYIEWVVCTGLRVEETLALRNKHVTGWDTPGRMSIAVPGQKTAMSARVIPIMPEAEAIVRRRLSEFDKPDKQLFPYTYFEIARAWARIRKWLGEGPGTTATLKALRRSSARTLHVDKGMPLDLVRKYLGHENIKTTMGYLHVTGGYSDDQFRRWFTPPLDVHTK